MPKKKEPTIVIAGNIFHTDGYTPAITTDGYSHTFQINVKLTAEDMQKIDDIRKEFFENEITSSTLGRILLHKGIEYYKRLSNSMNKHGL